MSFKAPTHVYVAELVAFDGRVKISKVKVMGTLKLPEKKRVGEALHRIELERFCDAYEVTPSHRRADAGQTLVYRVDRKGFSQTNSDAEGNLWWRNSEAAKVKAEAAGLKVVEEPEA